ncbi:hypothetical protein PIB30_068450 [Stylosanthes scabra]|uniref:Uncharacterized protein n=1 Tax=Stylosanthes scabra TaxID=79078 RepID=A0ABU6TMQ4_9FABA|nr:hypothetical protein [Stylosanthes scabra]
MAQFSTPRKHHYMGGPNSSAGGSLQLKTPEEAMELNELVANNQYMFTSDRSMKRGVMEVDTMDAILAQNKAIAQQLTNLNKKIEKLEVASMGTQGETSTTCGLCGGPHENHNCCLIREDQPLEQENYMGNQQRQPYQDPNANTYNPG